MLSQGARPAGNVSSVARVAREWWPLALIVAVGGYLRLAHLGALGFRWDEDLSGLAVRAILEKGVPELPSGMIYLRGGLFSHLMAASASLFGFSEFALRLPAALFGIALIVAAYLFGTALFGRVVGLVTAALLAVSFWDIDLSRYARFYSAFSVFYVLTLYAIWQFRVKTPSAAGGALCVVLAVVTLSLHDLAYSLALAFFYPLVLRGPTAWRAPREWVWPVVSSGVLAGFYLGWRDYVLSSRTLPALAGGSGGGAEATIGAETDELRRTFLALPDMPLLTGMIERAPVLVALLAVLAVGAALLLGRRFGSPPRERVMLALIAAAAALQLFNFALVGALVLAFAKRTGLPSLRSTEVLAAGAVIGAAFLAWVTAVLLMGVDVSPLEPLTMRTVVRELLDFPYFYVFWGFPNEWPLAAAVATVGALVAFHRAARGQDAAAGFALLALAGPLVGNALFSSPFEIFRYNAAFNTLFFVFVALAFVHWRELVPAWRPTLARPPRKAAAALGTAMLVMLATAYDLNPLRGWLAVQRAYSNDGALYRTFGVTAYSDFKTTADYVARHAAPHDLIVTPDSREYYNYLGRVDLWLRSARYEDQSYVHKGKRRDLYVDTPLIATLPELEAALATPNRTKWVLASSRVLANPEAAVAPEIRAFLRSQEQRVVYVGLDRDRKVYRFE
ncbi:MAG TPA: glycosyltransferase family 39 protein [Gammaproteobacteria bacterium]|nr:glycosyltransferase family 39 protein [Gammaproteobacteria bacterium]